MVTEWGMSQLGPQLFGQEDEPIFLGKEIAQHKDYSESTAQAIDNEVRQILNECYRDAESILTEHKDQLEKLAKELVEKETLSDHEIREMFGFPARPQKDNDGDSGGGSEIGPGGDGESV